jgi:hypothetical protein
LSDKALSASILVWNPPMRVRLTRKLAECIDGVDISSYHVGDVLDIASREAWLLVAEQWAIPERRTANRPVFFERRQAAAYTPRPVTKQKLRAG